MENPVIKHLADGQPLTKADGSPLFSRKELEEAMAHVASLRRREGETREQALARLVRERDPKLKKLAAARDALIVAGQQPQRATLKAHLAGEAEDLLDQHVELQKRDGESTAQAYSRLAREREPGFVRIFKTLRRAQDLP